MQICEYPVLSIIISCHSSAKKAFSPSIPHPFKKKYGLMDSFSYHTKPKSLLGYDRGDHSESVLPDTHSSFFQHDIQVLCFQETFLY